MKPTVAEQWAGPVPEDREAICSMTMEKPMDKLDTAIERMRSASEISLAHYHKPILLTYSGGKDSDVCMEIARIAGIPFEVVNSHTTADAPETVYYIRGRFHEMELAGVSCDIIPPEYQGRSISMWSLIPQRLMPPTRLVRYCCEALKETAGAGRAIVTGVRWAESEKRRNTRGVKEVPAKRLSQKVIINNDNDADRRFMETCQMQGKVIFNPIIDWEDADVWDFLHWRRTESNPVYQRGFSRVGCIGCPLTSCRKRRYEFSLYPAYKRLYIHAFDRMLEARKAAGKVTASWRTGYDVYRWWMEDNPAQELMDWYKEMDNNG